MTKQTKQTYYVAYDTYYHNLLCDGSRRPVVSSSPASLRRLIGQRRSGYFVVAALV